MATPSQTGKPSPERIFGTLTAFQQTEALKAAIQLDIFTKIGEGATDAAAIAKAIGASERGTRILCDYMTIYGFLAKEGTHYRLTPDAAVFLDKRSPAYMGSMAGFLTADMHRANFGKIAEAVRKGGTVNPEGSNLSPHDEFWVEFARSMAGLAMVGAEFIANTIGAKEGKAMKVLDIAAGHGMFGVTIARLIRPRRSWRSIGRTCSRWPNRTPKKLASPIAGRKSPAARSIPNSAKDTTTFC